MNITHIDNDTLVHILYRALLNRTPDSEGCKHYISKLECDQKTLHQVTIEIIDSAEFAEKYNRTSPGVKKKLLCAGYSPADATSFAEFVPPPTEASKTFPLRATSGFFARYCRGEVVLDIGFTGYENPEKRPSLPGAIGVDLDYPGYDGLHLPWSDNSVDCVFSSHCLEHVQLYQEVIRDWYRVLKVGGHIVCIVPSRDLYEKKQFPPSRYNADHKRFYTPSRLAAEFEESLGENTFRIRHLQENDHGYDYSIGPDDHAVGCFEIELVIEKIQPPTWRMK